MKQTSGTALGTQGIATTATMNLEGDDLYGFTISDGTQSYTLQPTVVDISNTTSTGKFVEAIEDALLGSNIKTSMDTDGNVFFRRDDGGQIILQSFTSATGKTGSWTPNSGQGDAVGLDGQGTLPMVVNLTSQTSGSTSGPLSGGGSLAISRISVTTQNDASTALGAIDSALAYVQAERSNLGSIQNRLTHTIDNLSNIVTSTSAHRVEFETQIMPRRLASLLERKSYSKQQPQC